MRKEKTGSGAERRRFARFSKIARLLLKTSDGDDVAARSINLSRNGVYCEVAAAIPVMTALSVHVELPVERKSKAVDSVQCEGVVVRSEKRAAPGGKKGYNIAIFFNHMSQTATAKFARFVETPGREDGETSLRLPLED